ncbi:MAG: hypothetical protein AB7U52_05930 [Candidatus Izemoplasmatales bacterium]
MQTNDLNKNSNMKYQKLIIFIIFVGFIIYGFLTVIFSTNNLYTYLLGGALFVLLTVGLIFVGKSLTKDSMPKVSLKNFDFVFAFVGVILTYELSNLVSLSPVFSSAFIGVIGYLFFRKHSVALYCGSFAGMVSPQIFNFYEVIVLGLICAIIYLLAKTILDGFGGRLGTIAFVSTTIATLIFNKDMLLPEGTYNIALVFVFAVLGSVISYYMHNHLKLSPVLSSALPSLLLAGFIDFLLPEYYVYSSVFFIASFVGMSNNKVIKNLINSLFVGIILGIIFLTFYNYFNGFGGKMGLMALISVTINYALINIIQSKNKNIGKLKNSFD